jgi:hypothetical protein
MSTYMQRKAAIIGEQRIRGKEEKNELYKSDRSIEPTLGASRRNWSTSTEGAADGSQWRARLAPPLDHARQLF